MEFIVMKSRLMTGWYWKAPSIQPHNMLMWGHVLGLKLHAPNEVDPHDFKKTYKALNWGDRWCDAGMPEVVAYLRGSKLLEIPRDWRECLPAEL